MNTEEEIHDLPATVNVDRPMTIKECLSQGVLIQRVLEAVMVVDVHYGLIPGTKKPTLYQAGAEKICTTFRLAPKYEVEDLCDIPNNLFRYRVKCSLYSINTMLFVGSAMGEASTAEEKYAWARAVCRKQYDEEEPSRKRVKYSEENNEQGYTETYQVQRNCADLANTVLKMAVKRAFVSATKNATAASDILDVDMDEEVVREMSKTHDGGDTHTTKAKAKKPPVLLPFGAGKGKDITSTDVSLDLLKGMARAMEDSLKNEKQKQYWGSNRNLLEALKVEIAKRESQKPKDVPPAENQPEQKEEQKGEQSSTDGNKPMDDATWTDYCSLQKDMAPEEFQKVVEEFKLKDPTRLHPSKRDKFIARLKFFTTPK